MDAIVFNNVTKIIGRNKVLDNINLSISLGQVVGLKGINGSGKTMMMRLIAGLIYPTTGEILINGERLGKEKSFPESIGLLLENPAFLGNYTGEENLKLLASIKMIASKQDIYTCLRRVGLIDAKNKKYRKYSLGMKQRLGISAAIMESPQILLLDEPTNSLDSEGIEMVKSVIKEQAERGATIILSCHDTLILESVSDEVVCLECGRVVDKYKPERI